MHQVGTLSAPSHPRLNTPYAYPVLRSGTPCDGRRTSGQVGVGWEGGIHLFSLLLVVLFPRAALRRIEKNSTALPLHCRLQHNCALSGPAARSQTPADRLGPGPCALRRADRSSVWPAGDQQTTILPSLPTRPLGNVLGILVRESFNASFDHARSVQSPFSLPTRPTLCLGSCSKSSTQAGGIGRASCDGQVAMGKLQWAKCDGQIATGRM